MMFNSRFNATALLILLALPSLDGRSPKLSTPAIDPTVVVEEVAEGSAAQRSGLKKGDILLRWVCPHSRETILSPFDVLWIERDWADRGPIIFFGIRDAKPSRWLLKKSSQWGLRVGLACCRQDDPNTYPTIPNTLNWQDRRAWLQLNQAQLLNQQNPGKQSDQLFEKALTLTDGHYRARTEVLRHWSAALAIRGDHVKAIALMKQAVAIDRKTEPTGVAIAKDLGKIAGLSMAAGEFSQSTTYIDLALTAWQNIQPQSIDFAKLLAGAGALASAQGNLTLADQYNRRALQAMRQSAPKGVEMAALLNNLAAMASKRGEYTTAEEYLLQSAALFSSLHQEDDANRPLAANTWSGLANIAGIRGDLQRSEEYDRRALALSRDNLTSEKILTNLAITATDLHDFDGARKYLDEAILLENSDRNGANVFATLQALGDLELKVGHLVEAERTYLQASRAVEEGSTNKLDQANIAQRLGNVQLLRNDFRGAELFFREAAHIRSELLPNSVLYAESLASLGACMMGIWDWNRSATFFQQAIAVLDTETTQLGGGRTAERRFRDAYADYYFQYTTALVEQGDIRRAFEISEQGRARILIEMLREEHITQADRKLTPREKELNDTFARLADRRLRVPIDGKTTDQLSQIDREIRAVSENQSLVEEKAILPTPTSSSLGAPVFFRASEIQELLDPQTVLLEYSLGLEHSYLFVVTGQDVKMLTLPGRTTINEMASRLYKLWTQRNQLVSRKQLSEVDADIAKRTRDISAVLLPDGITTFFAGKKSVLVVPDGGLYYLPFSALFLNRQSTSSRLVDSHEVVNLPSASVLSMLRQKPRRRQSPDRQVAVFADPVFTANDARVIGNDGKHTSGAHLSRLPGSRAEAQMISSLLGNTSVKEFIDFASTRSTVVNGDLAGYGILHFSTHALVNTEQPELSGLVFSLVSHDGTPQVGYVTLQDVYAMRLKADLVVLSACETALGENSRGEGPVGLARAFLYAGSSRVLASLWRVNDDATAVFMRLFYQELRNSGFSPALALRKAQMEMSAQPRWSAPSYWAGFILEGDYNPMAFAGGGQSD